MDTFRAKGSRSNLSSPGDFRNDAHVSMVSLPLQDNLSVPLTEEDLDGSSGVLFPFYDSDTSMLYIVGKVSLAREGGRNSLSLAVCMLRRPWRCRVETGTSG